jgi:hypothetical protein
MTVKVGGCRRMTVEKISNEEDGDMQRSAFHIAVGGEVV